MKEGRPIEMLDRKRGLNVSIYMENEMIEALNELKWRERKSVSELIRLAVHDYLKAHGAGNPSFSLDNWYDNPEFQAVPTVFAPWQSWSKYIDSCSKQERLKLLKHTASIKRQVDARL